MKQRKKDKRQGIRVKAALPVQLEGASGLARDVSAGGVFIETDAAYALGSPVDVALDLNTPWGRFVIESRGRIVRLEHREDKIGVAVQFVEQSRSGAIMT